MNQPQPGFGLIEVLLLIIVVGVLGATGWYAFHTKHQTDQILAQSEKTSQSTVVGAANPNKVPSDWLWYENKDLKIKFAYPKTWSGQISEHPFTVSSDSNYQEFLGCSLPSCAVTYKPSDAKWVNSQGGVSTDVSVFAKSGNLVAYSSPLKGEFNCGSFGIDIHYQHSFISTVLGMCSKPTEPNEPQIPAGTLIYENEAVNMKTLLSSFTNI